ncbi:hypothetical protein C7M84_024257 [Penaeus vannamei]|uniref:Uncharacterized protein n=1 Tax=Penaeus vannamei TaxID=6689 RepID=A0A423U1F9_PENVA|nr:hypothetical protein C7M84_024257 [Penaeus vannamei]
MQHSLRPKHHISLSPCHYLLHFFFFFTWNLINSSLLASLCLLFFIEAAPFAFLSFLHLLSLFTSFCHSLHRSQPELRSLLPFQRTPSPTHLLMPSSVSPHTVGYVLPFFILLHKSHLAPLISPSIALSRPPMLYYLGRLISQFYSIGLSISLSSPLLAYIPILLLCLLSIRPPYPCAMRYPLSRHPTASILTVLCKLLPTSLRGFAHRQLSHILSSFAPFFVPTLLTLIPSRYRIPYSYSRYSIGISPPAHVQVRPPPQCIPFLLLLTAPPPLLTSLLQLMLFCLALLPPLTAPLHPSYLLSSSLFLLLFPFVPHRPSSSCLFTTSSVSSRRLRSARQLSSSLFSDSSILPSLRHRLPPHSINSAPSSSALSFLLPSR